MGAGVDSTMAAGTGAGVGLGVGLGVGGEVFCYDIMKWTKHMIYEQNESHESCINL